MRAIFKPYFPFIRAGMQELISYRVDFFLYRIGDVIGAFVAYYLWKAVFDASNQELLNGFSLQDMMVYLIVGFMTNLLTRSNSTYMVGAEVTEGSIAMRLLKPVHFAASYLFTEIGMKLILVVTVGLPYLMFISAMLWFETHSPLKIVTQFSLYLVSICLAYLINFFFQICFGFSSLVLKNLWGTNFMMFTIVSFLSGNMIPLVFFPSGVARVLISLPFASLVYSPTMILMGKYSLIESLQVLGLQVVWFGIFLALSEFIWKRVQKYLTVQGG